jgi:hypothetical protein
MHIAEPLLEKLMLDNNINETQAADLFYTSGIFGKLADKTTGLYRKSWHEIYELLKLEIQK